MRHVQCDLDHQRQPNQHNELRRGGFLHHIRCLGLAVRPKLGYSQRHRQAHRKKTSRSFLAQTPLLAKHGPTCVVEDGEKAAKEAISGHVSQCFEKGMQVGSSFGLHRLRSRYKWTLMARWLWTRKHRPSANARSAHRTSLALIPRSFSDDHDGGNTFLVQGVQP